MKTAFFVATVCLFATLISTVEAQEIPPLQNLSILDCQTVEASGCNFGHARATAIAISNDLHEMWNREHPDGTQHGHITYSSNGIYYYHRPYNGSHYRQHQMRLARSIEHADLPKKRFSEGFQYTDPQENHLFRLQVRSADPKKDAVDPPKESGVLEFADWNRFEAANLVWKKEQESKAPEESTPARLSSHSK